MSRREDRSSESKRHRSRFDRDPSPKRSRRDAKLETERAPTEPELEKARVDRHHRRLHDPLPLEAGSKAASVSMNKHSSDPSKPQSYFQQHDDRGSSGQNGRSSSRRIDSERGWWRDSKEQQHAGINETISSDAQQKEEKSKGSREGNHGYFEMEANPKPSLRKRPAFREQKIPADPEKTSRDAVMPDAGAGRGRRNERWNGLRYDSERPFGGGRELNKGQSWGWRDRFRGRDKLNGRQGGGGGGDKWKHDLYSEANRSPQRAKNEDDEISKIEALLAS